MRNLNEALQVLVADFQNLSVPFESWLGYARLVEEVNAQTNLVSAQNADELVSILFADALQIVERGWLQANENGMRVVDVGSGAGAPTLPLALALPELRATLVEARRRRVTFLRRVIGELNLAQRVEVAEYSVSTARPQIAGAPFDVAMSRATWPLKQWLTLGFQLAPRVVAFAGAGMPAPVAMFKIVDQVKYKWPAFGTLRTLALCERLGINRAANAATE